MTAKELDTDSKLDLVIEALDDLNEQISLLREELSEKINNMSLPGVDYNVDEFDS